MAWIKRDDQDHTAYLVTVTWSRTGHGGLSDSPRSVNIVLEPKSQKRNLVQWSIHEVVIHSKSGGGEGDRIQGHYYFFICAQTFKVYILSSSGPGIQFNVAQECISILFQNGKSWVMGWRVYLQAHSDSGKEIDAIHFSSVRIQLNYTQKSLHILLVSL